MCVQRWFRWPLRKEGGAKRRRKEIRGIRARLRRLEEAGTQLETEGRGGIPLYLGSPDDRMDGKGPRRRKRVACASGSGLFFSYVIDDSGMCSSFLVQNGDSTVYYISAMGGWSVKFPYANLTSLPMQKRLLSVVDETKGGVE